MLKAITSKENPKIKYAYSLKDKKYRLEYKMFLAESFKSLKMALEHNRVVEVFTTSYLDIDEAIPQNLVSEEIIKKLSSTVNPEGIVFICKTNEEVPADPHKILFLDEINDPGNMGTLIRTALAFSYDLVIASDKCVSAYNEKAVAASKGAIFALPVIKGYLKDYKGSHKIIVSTLSNKAQSIETVEVPEKFVLVIGNESHGVGKDTRLLSDIDVKISIDNIDSLNAAIAGGILMYKFH